MAEYVLDHELEGEAARLALMSRLLDPMHRRQLEALGVGPGKAPAPLQRQRRGDSTSSRAADDAV
jgi:hypothetical protein